MANPTKANPRDDGRRGSVIHRIDKDRPANHTGQAPETPPDVNLLLSRLERVKPCAKGWMARCPAHEDRNASLSVAMGDDGRLLVHCFAGCAVGDVLAAVGLTVTDMFPKRLRDMSPKGRHEASQFVRMAQWGAALGVLAFESTVIVIASNELTQGRKLPPEDEARLLLARERVIDARTVLA